MLRILLAEDNRGDVFLVREALESHNIEHELEIITDGQLAIDCISRMGQSDGMPCPDLIILDLNLPKGDGCSVLVELRKHRECHQVPVIVVTSSDSPKDRERVSSLGIHHYFRKPSRYEDFMRLGQVVKDVLAGGTSATA